MNQFLLHAKTLGYKKSLECSRRIIYKALSANSDWFCAFSGGKDSTVTLALVREQSPDTPAVSSIQQWRLPETAEYLSRVDNLVQVASGSDHNTGWAANWESEADLPDGVQWLGEKGNVTENYGQTATGVFLGTRAEESSRRRKLYRARGALFFHKGHQVWQCSPIAEWSVMDVWGFIYSQGLDYNRAYDRLTEIGIPLKEQRVGPLAVERVLGRGQLAVLKRGWPELFNEYAAIHPEARLYI